MVGASEEKPSTATSMEAGLDIPYESQTPQAPESFNDADLPSHSDQESTAQASNGNTDKGSPGEQRPEPAASTPEEDSSAQQMPSSEARAAEPV